MLFYTLRTMDAGCSVLRGIHEIWNISNCHILLTYASVKLGSNLVVLPIKYDLCRILYLVFLWVISVLSQLARVTGTCFKEVLDVLLQRP